jgi:hypothetical protein
MSLMKVQFLKIFACLIISTSSFSFAADTSPPELESWEIISSDTINLDNGAGIISVKFRITDESGFEEPRVTAGHDSGQSSDSFNFGPSNLYRISGDEFDGTWQADISISQGSAPGTWTISLFPLTDTLGNSGSFGPLGSYENTFFVGVANSIDLDGNQEYDALTDGLLLLRGMFGLDGSALVTGTIASNAVYTESVDIESRIKILGDLADIDGNGEIDALTDGLLTLRYLFGLQGDTLINGVVAGDATRKTAEEIEAHLASLMPAI